MCRPASSGIRSGQSTFSPPSRATTPRFSATHELLSQGDNWFIFHLLSAGDLMSVKKVNAHFSDDILSTLLNEPIPGHGVFWSSAGGKTYPIPLRVLLFEQAYKARDPEYKLPRAKTFAEELK